jgi:5-methylcytosine-specific restriction endonuclease McrA
VFAHAALSMDHIVPTSRGGRDTWGNLVAACKRCNQAKANRTPEEARMPLLYVPYTPNRYEEFLVRGRRVIADQMAFLMAGVPRHSRLG